MAKGNFLPCLDVSLEYEGGYSDHARDPGGATMKGVTLEVYRKHKPGASKSDLRAITETEIEHIYRVGYWNPLRGELLPLGVDLVTFDYGVNSGPSRAAKALQAVVGAKVDGAVGPETVAAAARGRPSDTVKAICAKRLGFVRGLSTFSTFGKGWSRRIADVEARGVKMALAAVDAPDVVMIKLQGEADAARGRSVTQDKAANSAGWSGVAGSGALDIADVNWWIIGGVLITVAAAAALVKSRSSINRARADAYDAISG